MNKRRILTAERAFVLFLATALLPFSLFSCKKTVPLEILDANSNVIATVTSFEEGVCESEDPDLAAYVDIVKAESVSAVCQAYEMTEDEAKEMLLTEGLRVYTYFEPDSFECLKKAASSELIATCNAALAATTPDGRLIAVYSKSTTDGEYINYATKKTPPYSAIKPLSVYAPAIDSGIACWSSMYEDSPVKQVLQPDGEYHDWPTNADGTYRMESTTVQTAVKHSLNTVAVKVLLDYGVENSISFMEKLGIELDFEKQVADSFGTDEILSAIALGYLNEGVSPVEMSGYYQIFANGGNYAEPRAVAAITSNTSVSKAVSFTLVHSNQTGAYTRILQESTAHVMNSLLATVVEKDGTGEAAALDGIPLVAKTGTGENYKGNWFIGTTPSFTVSVWHDGAAARNHAASIFKLAAQELEPLPSPDLLSEDGDYITVSEFPVCDEVTEGAFCTESGCLFGDGCKKIQVGVFWKRQMPEKCTLHH